MDQFSLKEQTAVLTGAARGLGLAFALALAEAGANIAVLDDVQPDKQLFQIRTNHKVNIEFYKTDVTNREAVTTAIENIEKDFGGIHVNVNATGIVTDGPFLTTSDKNIEKAFAVNWFTGSFLVAQACVNAMVRRRKQAGNPPAGQVTTTGTIVFIGSIATQISTAVQNVSCYSASKAAVRYETRAVWYSRQLAVAGLYNDGYDARSSSEVAKACSVV